MLSVVDFVLIQGLYIILWILGSTDFGMTDEFTCGYSKLSGKHSMQFIQILKNMKVPKVLSECPYTPQFFGLN